MAYQLKVHGLSAERVAALDQVQALNAGFKPTYRSRKSAVKMARRIEKQFGLQVEVIEIQ